MMARDLEQALGHLPLRQLNPIALAGIVLRWKDRYARHTAYTLRGYLARFLRNAEPLGAPIRLDRQLPRMPFPRARTTIATTEDFAKLMQHAKPWERLFLLLARNLAMRFSEAASICERSWNREKHEVTFRKKGGDTLTLPVTEEIEQLFAIAPEADPDTPYIFRLASRPMIPTTIRRAFRRLKARASVNPNLVIHDLRRTAAVAAMDATHDIRAVSQLLGHANISTTAWYLQHRDPHQLRLLIHELRPPTEVKQ